MSETQIVATDTLPADPFDVLSIIRDRASGAVTVDTSGFQASDLDLIFSEVIHYLGHTEDIPTITINGSSLDECDDEEDE